MESSDDLPCDLPLEQWQQRFWAPGGTCQAPAPLPPGRRWADARAQGLVAVGGDLSVRRLFAAYHLGFFPWFETDEAPILWWSPDPRMVLFPAEFRLSRSLSRTMKKQDFTVRMDSDFAAVIDACAHTPRQGQQGSWITAGIIAAYTALHAAGYAHSVEVWRRNAKGEMYLAGGLYGLAIGRIFYGESMFSRETDASKIALAHLVSHLRAQDFLLIDCQMKTAHLASLGAREIPRAGFLAHLVTIV
jgi:leucyl/phenylalanyl-tRNA--protein transferase